MGTSSCQKDALVFFSSTTANFKRTLRSLQYDLPPTCSIQWHWWRAYCMLWGGAGGGADGLWEVFFYLHPCSLSGPQWVSPRTYTSYFASVSLDQGACWTKKRATGSWYVLMLTPASCPWIAPSSGTREDQVCRLVACAVQGLKKAFDVSNAGRSCTGKQVWMKSPHHCHSSCQVAILLSYYPPT